MNKHVQISLTGVVATNPVYQVSDKGYPYISFRLAHSYAKYDKAKDKWIEDPTIWFTVKAGGSFATNLDRSLKKGDIVFVSGCFKEEHYKDGEKVPMELIVEAKMLAHDLTKGTSTFVRSVNEIFDAENDVENN